MEKHSQHPGKYTVESRLNAERLYEMDQRLFLLPTGGRQDEGNTTALPTYATSKIGFENTP